jgi:hypothetical protein
MSRLASVVALVSFAFPAAAMDSNFHIAFPLGTNSFTSDDVRLPAGREVPGGFRTGLRLGINVRGIAAAEFNIDAQGWDLFKAERGGLGFVGGGLRLHPVQIAQHWRPEFKGRDWDVSFLLGYGYHIVGEQADGGRGRAYEGRYTEFSLNAEYYVTDLFTVGLDLPFRTPSYKPQVYTNYEDGHGFCFGQSGNFITNRIDEGCTDSPSPVASVFSPAITLNFRIPLKKKRSVRAVLNDE